VQGVLAARIDWLPADVKTLLQTLAVLGKEFAWSLLTAVADQPEDELQRLLAHLQAEEFLYEQPAFPESAYTFKHVLTQEVAYNAVLLEWRRVLHEHTAQAIEGLFPERLAEHYNALAHHYSRSGNTAKAVDYLHRAGQQAVERSAYAEASSHLTAALDLLTTLPETRECSQKELGVQMALGIALGATRGYATPEVERLYTRARELCERVGEGPRRALQRARPGGVLPQFCGAIPLAPRVPRPGGGQQPGVLALAQQLAHPLSLTLALYWAAVLHQLRREAPLAKHVPRPPWPSRPTRSFRHHWRGQRPCGVGRWP